jgi:hypothetical protein
MEVQLDALGYPRPMPGVRSEGQSYVVEPRRIYRSALA